MVNYGNILIPLYIYPDPKLGAWSNLTNIAHQYPNVTFTAVVNPYSGPGSLASNGCPIDINYIDAISSLNAVPNIYTMGYVHTANTYNCGPTHNYICPCTQPIANLKNNITTYAKWSTLSCKNSTGQTADLHIDSIFVDEAPGTDGGVNLTYMSNVASYIRNSSPSFNGSTIGSVLFNAGAQTDYSYFSVADNIIVLENSETGYDSANISALDNGGKYARKSSMIIYNHAASTVQRDVETILNINSDSLAAVYLTDQAGYSSFPSPSFWQTFVQAVGTVVAENKKTCQQKNLSC